MGVIGLGGMGMTHAYDLAAERDEATSIGGRRAGIRRERLS
ncbi:hypothetical protein [Paractinoplanes ferrugineus]|nr:hypothetical protein [Actinoplanes ferrugineus]